MCYFRLIYFGGCELHTKRQKEGFHIKLTTCALETTTIGLAGLLNNQGPGPSLLYCHKVFFYMFVNIVTCYFHIMNCFCTNHFIDSNWSMFMFLRTHYDTLGFFVLLEVTDKSASVTYLIKWLHFAESVLCHRGYISDPAERSFIFVYILGHDELSQWCC